MKYKRNIQQQQQKKKTKKTTKKQKKTMKEWRQNSKVDIIINVGH